MPHDGPSCEICDEIGRGHAERLIGMIDHALNERDLSPNDITKIAVTIGPGSFTGVRVGLAAARGYAAALNICLLYTSPSPRDLSTSRMPSSA